MKQDNTLMTIETPGPGLTDITRPVLSWVNTTSIKNGLLTLFLRHTSASLAIQENADPDVLADLEDFFQRLVSRDPTMYRHTAEGPDDMPAHIRTALTQNHLSIPVTNGRPLLGTWQGLYLFEHRDHGHHRTLALHIMGE